MAAFLIFLLFAFHSAQAQQRYSNVSLGSSLTPNTDKSAWFSPSGLYAFGFFKNADSFAVGIFVAGIPEKTVVWTANSDNNPTVPENVTLVLTTDGRLILQQRQGQDKDVVGAVVEPISSASMLDTGNFVLYNRNQTIIWQSFEHPTNTILPGQRLKNGAELFSPVSGTDYSKGIFRLKMQSDGNLVQYPVDTPDTGSYAYYSSFTDGSGDNVTLNLDDDGHLYLYNGTSNIRNLTQGGGRDRSIIYRMAIDADGIFRVYYHSLGNGSWTAIWNSTNDKCAPKGLCGLNGFCIQNDVEPNCVCLPGFEAVNPDKWSLGCERNFSSQRCKAEDASGYSMRRVENSVWEDVSYDVLEEVLVEDCEEACRNDCNCEAAIFKDRQCKMQRLPLRYGRRSLSDSSVALIKVGTAASNTNEDPIYPSNRKKKEIRVGILIVGIVLIVFGFFVMAISGILIHRTRVWAYKKVGEERNVELISDVAPRAFTYNELVQATNGFKEELGKGAFGTVYKGILPGIEKTIAVKRLDKILEEGEREFQTEMRVIGRTHHKNLVRLLGYCLDESNRLLIYEFMSGGSLDGLLFAPENKLSLEERIKIALDIARGILYLHEECETQIIHCDIKPQNILMDQNMCAKISDFGLAKLLKHDQTKTFTGIRGTKGYVAPEWHRKLPVTVKADVYSFGIVLLEIICCRRSVDWSLSEDEAILDELVYDHFQSGQLHKLVSDEEVDRKKLERSIKVGLWCIQDEPSLRPSIRKVLLMLEGTVEIPIPPSPTSFLSAM